MRRRRVACGSAPRGAHLLPCDFHTMNAEVFFSVALEQPRRAEKDVAFSARAGATGAACALADAAARATGTTDTEAVMAAILERGGEWASPSRT